MRVRGNELFATDRLKQYRNIQLERDRLFKMKQLQFNHILTIFRIL